MNIIERAVIPLRGNTNAPQRTDLNATQMTGANRREKVGFSLSAKRITLTTLVSKHE
jgi:hypothetical protein